MKETCDACGAPATNWAQDIARFDTGQPYWEHEPIGEVKAGCNIHPVESQMHEGFRVAKHPVLSIDEIDLGRE